MTDLAGQHTILGTRRHHRRRLWIRFRRNRAATFGLGLLLVICFAALLGPVISPYDPLAIDSQARMEGPSAQHWLGTDDLGRDILARLLHGGVLSISEGLIAGAIALILGVPIGAATAYFRRIDPFVLRGVEILLALPEILVAIVLVAILGPSLPSVIVGIGLAGVPQTALLMRSLVLRLRGVDFVVAARATGSGTGRILVRHILPNCYPALIVATTFRVATGILAASALSFLGLGAQPPTPEWGAMLSNGRDLIYSAPHVAAFPGLAIALLVLALNLIGDGMRDMLDPRSIGRV